MDSLRIGVLVVGVLFPAYGALCMFTVDREAHEPETDKAWHRRRMREAQEATFPGWRRFLLLLLLVEPVTGAVLLVFAVAATGGFGLARALLDEPESGLYGFGVAGLAAASLYARYLRELRSALTAAADSAPS